MHSAKEKLLFDFNNKWTKNIKNKNKMTLRKYSKKPNKMLNTNAGEKKAKEKTKFK